MMYEKHAKQELSSCISSDPFVPLSDLAKQSPLDYNEGKASLGPDYSEGKTLVKDNAETGNDVNQANSALRESSSKLGEKVGFLQSQRTPQQLIFEEQERYLWMKYEKHAKLKVSSSIPDIPYVPLSHLDKSPGPDYSEGKALVKDNAETGNDTDQGNAALGESSSKLGEKKKVSSDEITVNREPLTYHIPYLQSISRI